MAREIVTYQWCDICLNTPEGQDEVREVGQAVVIAIDNLKPRALDLCEAHMKEWIGPIRELIQELGTIVDTGSAPATAPVKKRKNRDSGNTPGPWKCLDPECPHGPYRDMQSLRSHMNKPHGLSMAEARDRWGEPQKADQEETLDLDSGAADEAEEDRTLACGIEDCTWSVKSSEHARPNQARSMHRWRVHGIKREQAEEMGLEVA